ncbi:hypothetical protein [Leptolyngbya sp. BC1307]|uniref:hypothetical protein n=1 Tax=Leptolyngbya sp. BC1307 TaxID=2029589 RepID=UPI000EFD0B83|nr:hypothetical protein [Leptolyngbya sp. BC1307]
MDRADQQRVEQFLGKWLGSEGNERANCQGFFLDLCEALRVDKPAPKGNQADDPYCFDKDIKFYSSQKMAPTTRFANFYKAAFSLRRSRVSDKTQTNNRTI